METDRMNRLNSILARNGFIENRTLSANTGQRIVHPQWERLDSELSAFYAEGKPDAKPAVKKSLV